MQKVEPASATKPDAPRSTVYRACVQRDYPTSQSVPQRGCMIGPTRNIHESCRCSLAGASVHDQHVLGLLCDITPIGRAVRYLLRSPNSGYWSACGLSVLSRRSTGSVLDRFYLHQSACGLSILQAPPFCLSSSGPIATPPGPSSTVLQSPSTTPRTSNPLTS